MAMLEEHPQLTSGLVSWLDACGMLEGDPRFTAVESVREREDIYAEFRHRAEDRERERERQQRRDGMATLRQLLESKSWLSVRTTWRQVQEEVGGEAAFTNLHKDDALRTFEDVMHDLERADERERAKKRRTKRRTESKARDEFRKLLVRYPPGPLGYIDFAGGSVLTQ